MRFIITRFSARTFFDYPGNCPTGQVTYSSVTWPIAADVAAVRNLPPLRPATSLITMSPRSLLFSSDEETSRRLIQTLQELELEVEHCPEIFAAVEKITSRSFDVVVCDWHEGLEAAFLLKTSHELKSNSGAFTIAVTNGDWSAAAREAGANLVLVKPIIPDKAKYALLTCDEFLGHMRTWLPKLGFPAPEEAPTLEAENKAWPVLDQEKSVAKPLPARPLQPSPPQRRDLTCSLPVIPPAAAIFDDDHLRRSRIQTLFSSQPEPESGVTKRRRAHGTFLRIVAFVVAFLSVGYVFSEPVRSASVATTMAKICGRALEKTHAWLRPDNDAEISQPPQVAQNGGPPSARSREGSPRIRVTPVYAPAEPDQAALRKDRQDLPSQVLAQAVTPSAPVTTTEPVHIPQSLQMPIQAATLRNVSARITPSLLAALEPVSLPEEIAQRLLLQKVQPGYPEQALKAGLQGPVVLQAWIARDGTIRDLKLIRGSFLLGQAAYKAVKQWRYQPYLLNGRPVEAQTYVTIDFRLP